MKTLTLLVMILASVDTTLAQQQDPPEGARIASVQVSGFELNKLSPGLQDRIVKLEGTPLSRQLLRDLAAQIEAEQLRYVAAFRVTADPDGSARVVFVVARLRDPEHQADINTKYLVEEVRVMGVSDSAIDSQLRDEMNALAGKALDADQAERIEARLKAAFPDYDVWRRTRRGTEQGKVIIVFQLERTEASRWLRFEPALSHFTFHSDQGWSGFLETPIVTRNIKITPMFAMDTTDDLLEEYSGLGIRFEARKLGTERLGVSLEGTWWNQDWREQTLAALALNAGIPGAYEERSTFTPMVSFAITRQLRVSGGVSIAELEPLTLLDVEDSLLRSTMANAMVGSIGFDLRPCCVRRTRGQPRPAGLQHDMAAAFTVRSGTRSLESDYEYTRSLAQASYAMSLGKHRVIVSSMGGVIDGNAPLFERFALGDSRTLRGWDKYEISPAGGDRMFHASVEYRFSPFTLFVDTGSVWDTGFDPRFRVSAGFGLNAGPFYMTLAMPVNTDNLRAVFMMGLRFSTALGVGKY